MSWYVIDAVDRAYRRTKTCLLEPFDFWKWMKLAIIVMLIGGGGSNFNGGGNSYSSDGIDFSDSGASDSFIGEFGRFIDEFSTDPHLGLIIGILVLLFLLILFFSYVSSVMEFVLVDSLVSNDVRFWEYSRRYMRKGLGLFVFRILVGIILLLIIVAMALPFVLPLIGSSGENFTDNIAITIVSLIFLLIGILLVVAIIGGIIGSLLNLSIPVAIYSGTGIFRAFSNVFSQFRKDWQQIVVYWIGRFILGLIVGIAILVFLMLVIVVAGIFVLLIDALLYFALAAIISGSDTLIWIILAPVIFIQIILFILLMAFVSMPGSVFMKYHMLTFLQQWYPEVEIPVFDMQQVGEEEQLAPEA